MKIGELFILLGVDSDEKVVNNFEKSLSRVVKRSTLLVASLLGVSFSIKGLLEETFNLTKSMERFSAMTGLSTEELQRWQIIADKVNISADNVSSSVTGLLRSIAQIRMGQGNIAPFQILGIDIEQDPFQILNQLRERLKTVERGRAVNLISQMGISPEMIKLLLLTNEQLKEMSADELIFSDKNQRKVLLLNIKLKEFRREIMFLAGNLIANLSPAFIKIIQAFRSAGNTVSFVIREFLRFKEVYTALILVLFSQQIGMALVSLIGNPIAQFAAIMIGLFLVLDDFAAYFEGRNSVIALAIEGLKKLGEELKTFAIPEALRQLPKIFESLSPENLKNLMTGKMLVELATTTATKSVSQTNNTTFNVNSSAPAPDVAKEVQSGLKKTFDEASILINNEAL